MSYYENAQQAQGDVQRISESGVWNFIMRPPPAGGSSPIVLVSEFVVSVGNPRSSLVEVKAQIGVSNPSEAEYPMRPYIGVLHSVSTAILQPESECCLKVIRMDVIDPNIVPTALPWRLVGNPQLAPQVFGPEGTLISNAALMMFLAGG
jgi:hypothetical protein